jgi:hypothetical protein
MPTAESEVCLPDQDTYFNLRRATVDVKMEDQIKKMEDQINEYLT